MAARKRTSIQISKELAADLVEASQKVSEVVETLEVQLDKDTLKRLRLGEKEYRSGRYKTARSKEELERALAN